MDLCNPGPVSIDYLCFSYPGFLDRIWTVVVDVTMKMICWLEGINQPPEGINTLVSPIRSFMDAFWGRMGDKNIQKPSMD